jgi:hypothetical protein
MKVAIRTVSIASAVLWVFLIAFAVSAVFSVKDFQLTFGELQSSISPENEVVFMLPVDIVNKGLYGISDFNVSTEIVDEQGFTLARGVTLVPLIGTGQTVNTTHQIKLKLNEILNGSTRFLFDDVDLRFAQTFSMKAAELIPVQASSNMSLSWGAPLYNFTLGRPQSSTEVVGQNEGYAGVAVPVSFENHAFFRLNGTLQVRVYNNVNVLIGTGKTSFDVPQGSAYHKGLMVDMTMQNVTSDGHYEVFVETPVFSVGPLVVPYV